MDKEIVTVKDAVVSCEGPENGHPRVFLAFKAGEREISCPYCGRTFVRDEGGLASSGH